MLYRFPMREYRRSRKLSGMTPTGRTVKVVSSREVASNLATVRRSMKREGFQMQSDAGAETSRSLDRKADLVATFVRANSCTLPA